MKLTTSRRAPTAPRASGKSFFPRLTAARKLVRSPPYRTCSFANMPFSADKIYIFGSQVAVEEARSEEEREAKNNAFDGRVCGVNWGCPIVRARGVPGGGPWGGGRSARKDLEEVAIELSSTFRNLHNRISYQYKCSTKRNIAPLKI